MVGFPRLATPSSGRCRGPNCIPTKNMSKDLRLWPYLELRSLRMEWVVTTRWAPHPVGLCPFEKRKHKHREEGQRQSAGRHQRLEEAREGCSLQFP